MPRKRKINVHIVGAGEIGYALASQLSQDGCSVTVIDTDAAVVGSVSNALDVFSFQGNGASYATLQEVGSGESDIFIAVTDSDERNILACLSAHLMGAKHTIARVRGVEYAKHADFYRNQLGLSMTINPELAAAREIARVLRFPSATHVEVFAKGRAELVEINLAASSPLCGLSLAEIGQRREFNLLICAVVRGDEVYIPKGHFVLEAGDILYLSGATSAFRRAFKELNMPTKPLHTALIAGAGRVTYYLADLLRRDGVHVTVVEKRHSEAIELCRAVPDCSVMNDDAISYFDSMSDADIRHTDAFISLTSNDEYNVVAAMYAASLNIGKVISRLSSNSKLKSLQKSDRIATVSQEDTAVDLILRYARSLMNAEAHNAVESLYRLMDGRIEFLEFRVTESNSHLSQPIRQWRMKPDTLLACIMRGAKTIIPGGDDVIRAGDSVLVATAHQQIFRLEDIFLGGGEVHP
ncbi:MAG: Trk system potassium transporter TrkA [Oscillospiraceae bacterium]|nr:Trk system potassium transporter TrkA [Oscillospiraceae bacterium]